MDNIYEALKTIKEVCINNPSCADCPLRTKSEGCYMKYKTPSTWEIQQPKNRYFKED